MDAVLQAFGMVMDPTVLIAIGLSGLFGMFVGAVPGLTATMATALLVPITFFLPPVAAVATMVTATAMAIFAGDIPGALLRIPGTPASAAYCDESYAYTRKGQAETALGIGLVFSALGGLFGTVALIVAAPALAEVAIKFSSFEYFWLVLMGLTCAAFITSDSPLKGLIMLFLGLLVGSVGMENPAAYPRFAFDQPDLIGGISLIPALIGFFAISEVLRYTLTTEQMGRFNHQLGSVFKGQWGLIKRYPKQMMRGNTLGVAVGILPGAGADMAAWMSYAMSRRMSKTPEKFGTGHPEGLIEAGAANNSALSGAWIPALVFGIPGDSITAIVIGVLYMKDMTPGPMIFINNPQNIYAVFIVFIIANLLMLPLGWACIKASARLLKIPRNILMPVILLFCLVGAFAINNSPFDLIVLLVFGILGWVCEENGFPVAPAILGILLGKMLEDHFISSMIKSDGNLLAFVERPIAAGLALLTVGIWTGSAYFALKRKRAAARAIPATP